MAFSVNQVHILGNVGQDAVVRYTQAGKPVASFSLATTEWSPDGDKTEWHNITVWGKLAELAGRFALKGTQVHVQGRLQTREWQDKEGNTRKSTEIVARDAVFLGRRPKTEAPKRDKPGAAAEAIPYTDDESVPF